MPPFTSLGLPLPLFSTDQSSHHDVLNVSLFIVLLKTDACLLMLVGYPSGILKKKNWYDHYNTILFLKLYLKPRFFIYIIFHIHYFHIHYFSFTVCLMSRHPLSYFYYERLIYFQNPGQFFARGKLFRAQRQGIENRGLSLHISNLVLTSQR